MIDFHSACCHCFVVDDVVHVVFLICFQLNQIYAWDDQQTSKP